MYMITRRKFVAATALGLSGLAIPSKLYSMNSLLGGGFVSNRPPEGKRNFNSSSVEALIKEVKSSIHDPELAWLFENCFPNTLDTTVTYSEANGQPDTFVITGDIRAMWLRDSSAQVWPYIPLIRNDEPLRRLIAGVIRRQAKCILLDPYANAFLHDREESEWKSDITEMKPGIHERKWEIDSLCYPVRLAYGYWKASGDPGVFTADWLKAMDLVYRTLVEQQRKTGPGPYSFKRTTAWQTDTVPGNGWGNPVKPNGLIVSIFRPSDDATIFPYLIPSNYFAVTSLRQLAEIYRFLGMAQEEQRCISLSNEVADALAKNAIIRHPVHGDIYCYETDGFGNRLMMDDSNVPSLLSLPYLGCVDPNDPVYQNTRRFVLSPDNPYFFTGKAASGIGSPHTLGGKIWPMTLIMQALTSRDAGEIAACLHTLCTTHAGKGFMHESFNKDNPSDYTRSWFAWANTLFGELIIRIYHEYPEILKN